MFSSEWMHSDCKRHVFSCFSWSRSMPSIICLRDYQISVWWILPWAWTSMMVNCLQLVFHNIYWFHLIYCSIKQLIIHASSCHISAIVWYSFRKQYQAIGNARIPWRWIWCDQHSNLPDELNLQATGFRACTFATLFLFIENNCRRQRHCRHWRSFAAAAFLRVWCPNHAGLFILYLGAQCCSDPKQVTLLPR